MPCDDGAVRYCFQCQSEFEDEVSSCVECGVPLVDAIPVAPDDVGDPDEDQVAYELHEWSGEGRQHLDQLLSGAGVVHGWQGATLFVRADDEAEVDALVEEVEAALLPTLDPEVEHVVYELDEWDATQTMALTNRLSLASIAHQFDADGNLVAHASDEDEIDRIVDVVRTAVAVPERGTTTLEGVELHELMTNLFVAASDLARNPNDPDAVLAANELGTTLLDVRTPFGFEAMTWSGLGDAAQSVIDSLVDEDASDHEVTDAAAALRDLLRATV